MLMNSSDFYQTLPDKCCTQCGDKMEELADCYSSTCHKCTGVTFYPLSPVYIVLNHPTAFGKTNPSS